MKKRIFCMALALVMALALAAPVFAEEGEQAKRLVCVEFYNDGEASSQRTFSYEGDSLLPREMTKLNKDGAETGHAAFEYDGSGRFIHGEDDGAVVDLTYDEDGNLVKCNYTSPSSGSTEEVYQYEDSRMVGLSITASAVGTEPYYEAQYTYDDSGIRTGATGKKTSLGPDGFWADHTFEESYEYDEQGRMTSVSFSRDGGEPSIRSYIYAPGLVIEDGPIPNIYLVDGSKIVDYGYQSLEYWSIFTNDQVEYIFDDEGYLVKTDDGAGGTIVFTYEPVA